jgi:hypothetical protein
MLVTPTADVPDSEQFRHDLATHLTIIAGHAQWVQRHVGDSALLSAPTRSQVDASLASIVAASRAIAAQVAARSREGTTASRPSRPPSQA